jgi:hypothetical protein
MAPHTLIDDSGDTLETAVAALVDAAVDIHLTGTTAMVHCNMCGGEDENHVSTCPVPMLEQWLFEAAKLRPEQRAAIEVWAEQGFMPM